LNREGVSDAARLYVQPAIVHELKMEGRAGSPLGDILTDPLSIDPAQPR
jgi:hypothetical protein